MCKIEFIAVVWAPDTAPRHRPSGLRGTLLLPAISQLFYTYRDAVTDDQCPPGAPLCYTSVQ